MTTTTNRENSQRVRLKSLIDEAGQLRAKGNNINAAELNRAEELIGEISALQNSLKEQDKVAAKLRNLRSTGSFADDNAVALAAPGGSRVAKTAGWSGAISRARAAKADTAGVPSGTIQVDYSGPVVEDPLHQFSLASLVNNVGVDAPSGAYLRQTTRELNAAPVKIGDVKPESNLGMEYAHWELATIAHVLKPLARQWLTDIADLQNFVNSELAYGLDEATNSYLLNGGTSEAGNTITGVLNTTGIDTVPFTSDILTTIRTALRQLEDLGVNATGIALNSADWATLELEKDGSGRPYLTALGAQSAERTLWGVPVTIVSQLPAGTAVIADWSTVNYLRLNGSTQISYVEQGTYTDEAGNVQDLYTHNLVRARAEWRAGLSITSLPSIVKVTITEGH
jgi:HK97 family phage major capsid protein